MNLVLDVTEISDNNIFFYDSVKNTVMNDSSFIRIIYSNRDIVLNGIYIKLNIDKDELNKISTNELLNKFDNLEKKILNHYKNEKSQINKLREQVNYNINKINNINAKDCTNNYLLKISGIWETDNSIGLTYKFIYIH